MLNRLHAARYALILSLLLLLPCRAGAALTIEIVGGGATQIPISIVPFRTEETLSGQKITPVVSADLERSGLFKMVDPGGMVPTPYEPEQLSYPQWQARGAAAVVIGTIAPMSDGRYDVRFRLMDVQKQIQLAGFAYFAPAGEMRQIAHKIADVIYEKLTGDAGVFATRIAYVVKRGKSYSLQVADADGYGPQSVLNSNQPIMSPTWSPDGTQLAYVSFERNKPAVYVQSLLTGQRRVVANYRGSNSAPAWAPDGRHLAVVLTKDGNSQIYLINADGSGTPTRLTSSGAIDTEPNFSPDGQWLLFTSDRGGSPQIYRMPASGGQAQRLTFEGNYNVSPRYAPDGKSFAFVQRSGGGRFNIATEDFASRQVQVLTDGRIDESPSYAPNSRMILYASDIGPRGILAAVSSDGRVKQRFVEGAGDVREPAWGPASKK
jgi:TolB protein